MNRNLSRGGHLFRLRIMFVLNFNCYTFVTNTRYSYLNTTLFGDFYDILKEIIYVKSISKSDMWNFCHQGCHKIKW